MTRRTLALVLVLLLAGAPLAGVVSGLSTTDAQSDDLDIVFVDGADNLKYVDAAGNVVDTGVQADDVGGSGDFDGDGTVEVAFEDQTDNIMTLEPGGSVVDTGFDGSGPAAMVDFDGDGDLDIIYNKGGDIQAIDDDGNFNALGKNSVIDIGGAADVDGDSAVEVAYIRNGALKIVEASGATTTVVTDARDSVGAVEDLDGDGDFEIVHMVGSNFEIATTEPDGTRNVLASNATRVGGAGDLDADGTIEVVYRDNTDKSVNFIESGGTGTDLGTSSFFLGAVLDFDGDGTTRDDPPTASNPSPSSTTVSSNPVTLSVDVDDPELPVGDTVTVNISHEGTQVKSTKISSAQTVTADVQDVQEGTRSWTVTVTDSGGNTNSYSYTYTADYATPALTNPEPSGDIETYNGSVSVEVSDADFPSGDTVTVTASDSDGNEIGSETVTQNTTVRIDYGAITSGSNTIDWMAEDSHGATDTISQSFTAPDQLTVYNESAPEQEITGANLTAKFYFRSADPQIITRNASGGSVSLGGVPANEPFVVVVEADGYLTRRVVFSSLIDQQSVYLLPENKTKTEVVFEIEDYTGAYPQESTALLVQRGLNGTWQTVAGDYFGATGEFPAQLRYQARHRLVLVNLDTGQRRTAGSYTPLRASTQTISVTTQGEIDVGGRGLDVSIAPGTRTLTNTSSETITVGIEENDATLRNATIKAVYRDANRSSSTVLTTQNVSSPGEYQLSVDLRNRAGGSVDVVVDYETDGLTTSEVVTYTIRRAFANDHSLLAVLAGVAPRFPAGHVDAFQSVVVLFATVLGSAATASQFRASTELVGLVAVIILGGFAVISWIDYGVVFVAGVAWVALAGLRRGL